jgi:tetratricopeptide (TPR) repeat protein
MECMQQNRFEEAYDILDSIEPRMKDPGEVKMARAICYFVHARALADDLHLTQAIEKAGRALEIIKTLPPVEGFPPELIQKFINDNEKLAPEEENLRKFMAAKEYFERENYSMAIAEAGRIPESSKKVYKMAKPLFAAAYFHEGIAAANKENFPRAVEHFEHALDLIDTKENRKIITKQLAAVLNAYAISVANESQKTIQKFDKALSDIIQLASDQNNIQAILSMNSKYNINFGGSGSCPVCGSVADKISFLPTLIACRSELIKMNTSFGFWKNQHKICSSCRRKLEEVDEKIEKAVSLLERAKSLDKTSETIQKNLVAIRSIKT